MPTDFSRSADAFSGAPEAVRFLTALLITREEIGAVRLLDGGGTIVFEFFLNSPLRTSPFREFTRDLREAYDAFGSFCNFHIRHFRVHRSGIHRVSSGSLGAIIVPDGQSGSGENSEWNLALREEALNDPESGEHLPLWLTGCEANWESFSDSTESVFVERDVSTLSCDEISMLVKLVREELSTSIVVAERIYSDEETRIEENEAMEQALAEVRRKVQLAESKQRQLLESVTQFDLSGNSSDFADSTQLHAYPVLTGYREDMRVIVFADGDD